MPLSRPRRTARSVAAAVALATAALFTPVAGVGAGPWDTAAAAMATTPPTLLSVDGGLGKLFPAWTPAPGTPVKYRVYVDGSSSWSVEVTGTAATVQVASGTHQITVAAVYSDGSTARSAAMSGTTTSADNPGRPQGVKVVPGDRSATITWDAAPSGDPRDAVEVYRGGTKVATVWGSGSGTWTDTGLTNGTSYSYSLRALNAYWLVLVLMVNGTSPNSATVTTTPVDTVAPAAPRTVTVTPGDRQLVVAWTVGSTTETDRKEHRVTCTGTAGTATTTVSASTTTATLTGLTNGAAYTCSVVATDTSGNTSTAGTAAAATPRDSTAPGVPTGLRVTAADGALDAAWTALASTPDLASYKVSAYAGTSTTATTTATVAAGATSARLTGLVNGTAYQVRIAAVDTSGNTSAQSTAVTGTPVDTTAPPVPTGLAATAADRSLALRWNAVAAPDLKEYRASCTGGGTTATLTVAQPAVTGTVSGLVNGTSYSCTVAAVDTAGNASAASTAVTASPKDAVAPAAPTTLTATAADRSAVLAWPAVGDYDLASYRATCGTSTVTVAKTALTATLTGLVNGTTTSCSVVAIDTSGNASPATTATVVPRDAVAPAAPGAVAAAVGDGALTVTWTAPSATDLKEYRATCGTQSVTVPSGTLRATVTGLTNGTAYTCTVVAVDTSANTSPAGTAAAASPRDITPPPVPTGVSATAGDGAVDVSWSPVVASDLAGYRVTCGSTSVTAPAGATTATVGGLVNGTSTSCAVAAVDTSGNVSAASTAASATPRDLTAPTAPATVTAAPADGAVTLTWSASPEADVARYEVRDGSGTVVASVPATTTSATVTGLANGTAASFRVAAVDTAGNVSVSSAPVGATPQSNGVPAVTGLTGTAGDTRASLSWNAVTGAESYEVLDGTGRVVPAAGTTATVTGLVNGRGYALSVRAVAAGVAGPVSASISLTPRAAGTPVEGAGLLSGKAVSRDGRYVLAGTAAKLEASDTNTAYELYVFDNTTGARTRLDPAAAGTDLGASRVALSGDGRYAVVTTSRKQVPADTNALADVYRVDLRTGAWQLVSVPASGKVSATVAGAAAYRGLRIHTTGPSLAISADGEQVFFHSARADLVPGDTNRAVDLFRKDLRTGAVTRVSTTSTGAQLPAGISSPALDVTPDGRWALFTTTSQNQQVLWRKDLSTGALVPVSGTGTWGALSAVHPVSVDAHDVSISDDGRYAAFSSSSVLLTRGATDFLAYRKDLSTGQVARIGVPTQTSAWEHGVALDPTGRFAFFATTAGHGADRDGHTDWYRRDLGATGAVTLTQVTSRADGTPTAERMTSAESPAEYGGIEVVDADTVLVTTMQALVPGDVNKKNDVLRKDLRTGEVGAAVS